MLIIIFVIILLIMLTPVGVDFSLFEGETVLDAKIGFWHKRHLPPDPDKPVKEKKPKKEKKKRKKKQTPDETEESADQVKKKKPKTKLRFTFHDIVEIAKIALRALGRFGSSISVDRLEVSINAATSDPYDTAMLYGYINAALGTLMPLARRAMKIRREEINTSMSFEIQKTEITARVVATLQIWEILHIVFCAAFSALVWFIRLRRASKKAAKAAAGKGN